jgi:hypothetical protein
MTTILRAPTAGGLGPGRDDPGLRAVRTGLDRCDTLLARHLAAALARFGSPALGVIDLPPLATGVDLSADQIRAAATLYWTSEIEEAGLPSFVEALAEGVVEGRLPLPLTTGAARLTKYYHERHERFDDGERRALYARLFGDAGGAGPFGPGMRSLCRLLSELGRAPRDQGTATLAARINVVARDLAEWLSAHGTGIAGFAAREIVADVREALAILRHPDVVQALAGVGVSVFSLIEMHAPRVLRHEVHPRSHLDRATAGLAVLSWLADSAAMLADGRATVRPEDPLVGAAETWLTSLGEE